MSKIYFFLFFFILGLSTQAQIVITEIMYNPPESGNDSLEYIEIFNNSRSNVDLEGYTFTQGVDFTFPDVTLNSITYMVIAIDSSALKRVLGITNVMQWESGALRNGGEDIIITDPQGNVIDLVDYQNGGDWPVDANGAGSSLELCDVNRDNNDGNNWKASQSARGIVINDRELKASPNAANGVSCADHTIKVMNNFFDPKSLTINVGETVEWIAVEGIHNVNGSKAEYPNNPEPFANGAAARAPWSFSFTFNTEGNYDYQCDPHVLLGMTGKIIVIKNEIPDIVITEIMYHSPASDTLEFIELYNNGSEAVDMSGFYFANGIDLTFVNQIIQPDDYILVSAHPDYLQSTRGKTSIQYSGSLLNDGEAIELVDSLGRTVDRVVYDNRPPWNPLADGEGYSLILCDVDSDNGSGSNWSVSPVNTGLVLDGKAIFCNPGASDECEVVTVQYPQYFIDDVTTIDMLGFPDSIMVRCALQGIVHGVDLQGSDDIQFTLIDQTGGIGIYSFDNFNYTVLEGDELLVKGRIDHFNGLTQMYLDSLKIIKTRGSPFAPRDVTTLNESTESEIIRLVNVTLVNPGEWRGNGSSFNIDVTDGNNTYAVRIDDDTELANEAAPFGRFNLSGIGGQFDSSEPFDNGYQLLPRYNDDIDLINSTGDLVLDKISILPNPVNDVLIIDNLDEHVSYFIYNVQGELIYSGIKAEIDVSSFVDGIYFIKLLRNKNKLGLYFVKQ